MRYRTTSFACSTSLWEKHSLMKWYPWPENMNPVCHFCEPNTHVHDSVFAKVWKLRANYDIIGDQTFLSHVPKVLVKSFFPSASDQGNFCCFRAWAPRAAQFYLLSVFWYALAWCFETIDFTFQQFCFDAIHIRHVSGLKVFHVHFISQSRILKVWNVIGVSNGGCIHRTRDDRRTSEPSAGSAKEESKLKTHPHFLQWRVHQPAFGSQNPTSNWKIFGRRKKNILLQGVKISWGSQRVGQKTALFVVWKFLCLPANSTTTPAEEKWLSFCMIFEPDSEPNVNQKYIKQEPRLEKQTVIAEFLWLNRRILKSGQPQQATYPIQSTQGLTTKTEWRRWRCVACGCVSRIQVRFDHGNHVKVLSN